MYLCLSGDCYFCSLFEDTVPVLDPCNSRRNVSGGIQALSRSYFTKIIPEEHSGEYFGLMDICGKGASFVGTTIVSIVSQLTGNISMGVGMIAILFCIGIVIFLKAVSMSRN